MLDVRKLAAIDSQIGVLGSAALGLLTIEWCPVHGHLRRWSSWSRDAVHAALRFGVAALRERPGRRHSFHARLIRRR